MKLPVVLGKQQNGEPLVADLTELPHLLIGGATGSGKSNLIANLIAGLASEKSPEEVKFLLVDPKAVEFPQLAKRVKDYLYQPVYATPGEAYTDCVITFEAISELQKELERRENMLRGQYRSIEDYNAKNEDKLPYILLIIDEYGDLIFMSGQFSDLDDDEEGNDVAEAGEETDTFITDLIYICQHGHRLGIHVVISTQRSSPEIVSGVIKASIPSRIAFKVISEHDSDTLLDRRGAELLESPGDFIFSSLGDFVFGHAPLHV